MSKWAKKNDNSGRYPDSGAGNDPKLLGGRGGGGGGGSLSPPRLNIFTVGNMGVMIFWAYRQPSILHIHTWCILNHSLDNNSHLLHAFSRKWCLIEVTSFPQLLCPAKHLLSQASRPTLPPTLGQMESSYSQWDKWVRFPRIEEASGNVWDSGTSLTYIVYNLHTIALCWNCECFWGFMHLLVKNCIWEICAIKHVGLHMSFI